MTAATNGRYETMHGPLGDMRFGGDKMVLCDAHAYEAVMFAESMMDAIDTNNGYMVKRERPFKIVMWSSVARPCEACATECHN